MGSNVSLSHASKTTMTDTGKVIPANSGRLRYRAFAFAAEDVTRSGFLSRRGPAVVCYFVRRLPEGVVQ